MTVGDPWTAQQHHWKSGVTFVRRFFRDEISSGVVEQSRDLQLSCNMLYLLRPRLCFFKVSSCETNNELNLCTTSETEGEVGAVKHV